MTIPPIHGRPAIAVDMVIEIMKANPEWAFGPLAATFISATVMLGVLLAQTARYFSAFGYESLWMFVLVCSCIVFSVWQWAIMMALSWDWFVVHYGDWSRYASLPWSLSMLILVSRIGVFVSQTFFAYRCYTLYNKSKIVFVGIVAGMLASLALSSYSSVLFAIDPYNVFYWERFTTSAQFLNLATDASITGLTLWKLARRRGGRQGISRNTADVLNRLRNAILQAAAPPAVLALLTVVSGLGWKSLTYQWLGVFAASLYVWSLMFTLNSRIAIRKVFNSPNGTDEPGELPISTRIDFARPKPGRPDAERTTFLLSPFPNVTLLSTSIRRGPITDLEQQLDIRDGSAETSSKPRQPRRFRRHSESSAWPSKVIGPCLHCEESTWGFGAYPR